MRRSILTLQAGLLASTMLLLGGAAHAQALPDGGTVTRGAATIESEGGAMTIRQASDRAVIDWKRFDIGEGGRVDVRQSGPNAALLNRVTGGDMSRIAGSLTANGQVFLINQNGIAITPTGRVDAVGGFVASTLDIADDDFMAGKLAFAGGGAGTIVNQGYVRGGAVALLGSRVANEGVVVSTLGRVGLASAQQATLDLNGDGFLQVAIPADLTDAGGAPLISNSGLIDAAGGHIVLKAATAREIVRQAVNMSGVIRATHATREGGSVLLDGGSGGSVQISGTIEASGSDGGRIDVTGGDVSLAGATLSAQGADRGGLVRVGGAFQGGAPVPSAATPQQERFTTRFGTTQPLASARTTSVDAASTIDVSGAQTGGSAVLWSDVKTVQAGQIRATGATGGAIEVSSHGTLLASLGNLATGQSGLVLLDPKDIAVYDAASFGAGFPADPHTDATQHGSGPATANLNVADLNALMDAGTDVYLRASNDISWNGDLSIGFGIADPGDLYLSAGRSIAIGATLTLNQANLTAIANDSAANGVIDADRDPGGASIDTFNGRIFGSRGAGTGGNISLTVGTGAGLTNNQVISSRIGEIEGRMIAIDGGGSRLDFYAYDAPIGATALRALDSITLTGDLRVATLGGLTLDARQIKWTNEATARLTTTASGAPISFVENGVRTRYGVLAGGAPDTTRLALGKGTAGTDYSVRYGDAYPTYDALHVTRGALRAGDTLTSILAADSTQSSGPAAGARGGDYDVVTTATTGFAFADSAAGYFANLTSVTDTLRVQQQMLTPTVIAGLYSYGSPTALVTLAGLLGTDTVNLTADVTGLGSQLLTPGTGGYAFSPYLAAGSRSFTLTGLSGGNAADYTLDLSGIITAPLTINPKALTFIGYGASSTYGTLAAPEFVLDGILNRDAVNVGTFAIATQGGAATPLTARTGVGTYATFATALTGAQAGNYTIAATGNLAGSLTIAPKALTYSVASSSGVYGTLGSAATPTLNGVLAGDELSVTRLLNGQALALDARTAAGTYAITPSLSGSSAGNYVLAATGHQTGALTIAPRLLGYSIDSLSQPFDTPGALLTLSGILDGDQVMADATLNGAAYIATALGNGLYGYAAPEVGSYLYALNGLYGAQAANYALDPLSGPATGTLTVTPKPITYSIASLNSIYGNLFSLPTPVFHGVNTAFQVSAPIAATRASAVVTLDGGRTPAGTYMLSVAPGSLTGVGAHNYMLAATGNVTGTLTIDPRPIRYTAPNVSAIYGSLANLGTPWLDTVNGDVLGTSIAVYAGSTPITLTDRTPVGTYSQAVTALSGASAVNYVLVGGTNGAITIAPRPITFSLGQATSTYGDLADPLLTLSGVLGGDAVFGNVTAFTNVAADGGQITDRMSAGRRSTTVASIFGASSGNYVLASSGNQNGSLLINPRLLHYSIDSGSSIYGEAVQLPGVTFSGLLDGDDAPYWLVDLVGGDRTALNDAGIYGLSATIGPIANYLIADAPTIRGTYTITPRPLSLAISGGDLGYGVRPDALGVAVSNVIFGDSVGATLLAPTLTTSSGGYINVGTYALHSGALIGRDAANYFIAEHASATVTVAPRTVFTVSPDSLSTIYGTMPVLPTGTVSGTLAGDQLFAAGSQLMQNGTAVAASAQTPVGSYVIRATGVGGADAGNYLLDPASITGNLTVTPKSLTYVAPNATSIYGTAAQPGAALLNGIVDNDSVAGVFQGFDPRLAVGSYAIDLIGLTGASAGNYSLAASGNTPGLLRVDPKALTYAFKSPTFQSIYGDAVDGAGLFSLGGVLDGDEVGARLFMQHDMQGVGYAEFDSLLNAGSYMLDLAWKAQAEFGLLNGRSAGNYILPLAASSIARLDVAKRVIDYRITLADTAIYGGDKPISIAFGNMPVSRDPSFHYLIEGASTQPVGHWLSSLPHKLSVGAYTVSAVLSGEDVNNLVLSGSAEALTITPRPVTATGLDTSTAVYASRLDDLISLDGVLDGDDVTPLVSFGNGSQKMIASPKGFGVSLITSVPGYASWSVDALTGSAAGNYVFTGTEGGITITPKPITYTTAGFTAQYGGLTQPSCGVECASVETRDNGLVMGSYTLNGVLESDLGFLSVDQILINARGGGEIYARDTDAGNYLQAINGFSGSRASYYTIATEGNVNGPVTITPAWIQVTVTDGSRLYHGIANRNYEVVGTPGNVTMLLSSNRGGRPVTEFRPGEDVRIGIVMRNPDGSINNGSAPLTVGSYALTPVLLGYGAGNYRITPTSGVPSPTRNGELIVADLSIFDFSLIGVDPNYIYVPPAATTKVWHTHEGSVSTASGNGRASASGSVDHGALSYVARGTASAGYSTSTSSDDGTTLSAGVSATTAGLASFSPTGVYVGGQANAGATIGISHGPGYLNMGAQASTAGALTIDPLSANPAIMIDGSARVGVQGTGGVAGELGSGVSGELSNTTSAFLLARSNADITFVNGHNVGVSQFVGGGVSTGITGGLSGGGVSGSAAVTVYSPGSLYIGARSVSDYSEGTFTLGFTIGLSIGIGGLEIAPKISFSTAKIEEYAVGIADTVLDVFSGDAFKEKAYCYSACQAQRAEEKLASRLNEAVSLSRYGTQPTLEMMAYLEANPDVVAAATPWDSSKSQDFQSDAWNIRSAYAEFGGIPDKLGAVIAQQQEVAKRLNADPSKMDVNDVRHALNLREQEKALIQKVAKLGGKITVDTTGKISLVEAAQPSPANQGGRP